jgi:hypothetical protein
LKRSTPVGGRRQGNKATRQQGNKMRVSGRPAPDRYRVQHTAHRTETAVADRHLSIVDAHVILRRDGEILLLRRAGNVYDSGQLCLLSVH